MTNGPLDGPLDGPMDDLMHGLMYGLMYGGGTLWGMGLVGSLVIAVLPLDIPVPRQPPEERG